MPFTVKDALQYKRTERQRREIHEREYSSYLSELHQQQRMQQPTFTYLSPRHAQEVERSRVRYALGKQIQYDRIARENHLLMDRLRKASERAVIDDRNADYRRNLDTFNSKRCQQRLHGYKRIHDDNQVFLQRLQTVQGRVITKERCEDDWQKHLRVMKTSCEYPENIDRFVSRIGHVEGRRETHTAINATMRSNHRHD